eukprot:605383-Pyramimonas_sp.AAC.1
MTSYWPCTEINGSAFDLPVFVSSLPAHHGQVRPPPNADPRSQFFVESFNANRGIRTLKENIQASSATIFVAQE